MRIIVINTAASSGGALSILESCYNFVIENDKHNEWIFILSKNHIKDYNNVKVIIVDGLKKSWIKRLCWEYILGGKYIMDLNPDVVFSLQNTIPMRITTYKVLYVQQAIPFSEINASFFKRNERTFWIYKNLIGKLIFKSIKISDKVIVQSQWMKQKCIQKTGIRSNKIFVCKPNVSNVNEINKYDEHKMTTFFYPATAHFYKNHAVIINASKQLLEKGLMNFRIIFTIDKKDNNYAMKLFTESENCNIDFVGEMRKKDVYSMYKNSVLLFPSILETVGLPLLEAQSTNTLILAANCDYTHETLGEYKNAYYFEKNDYIKLAELMQKSINNNLEYNSNIIRETKVNENNSWSLIIDILTQNNKIKSENNAENNK